MLPTRRWLRVDGLGCRNCYLVPFDINVFMGLNQRRLICASLQAGGQAAQGKGSPEEVAEQLVSEVDGGDIKSIELERKHAEIKPGQPGSGVQRGSAAAAAQVIHDFL